MTCTICCFDTELDDVAVACGARTCICLRCFARETGSEVIMPKDLRHDLIAALSALPA
jgi:hypothetical protein